MTVELSLAQRVCSAFDKAVLRKFVRCVNLLQHRMSGSS